MYICIYVYVCIYIYTHTSTHAHKHIYIYIYIYVYVHDTIASAGARSPVCGLPGSRRGCLTASPPAHPWSSCPGPGVAALPPVPRSRRGCLTASTSAHPLYLCEHYNGSPVADKAGGRAGAPSPCSTGNYRQFFVRVPFKKIKNIQKTF